jgi:hypothetical protein
MGNVGMPQFPSVTWFDEAGKLLNDSDSFQRLGTCDAEMGVRSADKFFQLTFEAFEFTGSKEVTESVAEDLDFTLIQEPGAWRAMLENIKENGLAEHEFTLNSLDLRSEAEFAIGKDYHRRDLFYRFNQTFQEYFDQSAKMETTF